MRSAVDVASRSGRQPGAAAAEVARLDRRGTIVSVNREWTRFCVANGGEPERCGPGRSYLDVCLEAADDGSLAVADAIRSAVKGDLVPPTTLAIACDSPGEPRWYDLAVYPRVDDAGVVLGANVVLWRVGGPAEAPVPDGGVLPLLREAARAIDQLWRQATAERPTAERPPVSAIQLGEASQGVHRALIALSGTALGSDTGAPAARPDHLVLTSSALDEAIQHLTRSSLALHGAAKRASEPMLAGYVDSAISDLDRALQDLRRIAFRRS